MSKVTQEFLETHGFSLKSFPDGYFWVKEYGDEYVLQADESLTHFTEDDGGWVSDYLESVFYQLVLHHAR